VFCHWLAFLAFLNVAVSVVSDLWRHHPQNLSLMQQRELQGDQCARKEFKPVKPEEFSPYRRSAGVEILEPLQPPMNSDAMYAVVTASPELVYTRTDDDILDPEIHRVDGSIQLYGGCSRLRCVNLVNLESIHKDDVMMF